jgi:hypothetical protein
MPGMLDGLPMWKRGPYKLHSPPQQFTCNILFEEILQSISIFQSRVGITKFPNEVCISTPHEPWRFQRNTLWNKFKNEAFGVINAAGPIMYDEGNNDK